MDVVVAFIALIIGAFFIYYIRETLVEAIHFLLHGTWLDWSLFVFGGACILFGAISVSKGAGNSGGAIFVLGACVLIWLSFQGRK